MTLTNVRIRCVSIRRKNAESPASLTAAKYDLRTAAGGATGAAHWCCTSIDVVADLRRLQYFVAVASERNFTRAAAGLHIAQPALSRQVRLLEQELGTELLHRTTHEVELTEAGEYLLRQGPDLLSAADDLWRSVRAFGNGDRGALVFAYGASASYETAPQLVHALAERQPTVGITTLVKSVTEIVAGVGAGSIDIGLVRCPPTCAGVEVRPVRRERQGVLMRRDHALASRAQVGVAEIVDDRLLMHPREANPGHYDAVLALCREHGVEPEVVLRAMSFDLGYGPIHRHEAVAIVGESSRLGLPDELCWVPLHPEVRLDVSFLVRSHNRPPAVDRVRDAADVVAAELQWT